MHARKVNQHLFVVNDGDREWAVMYSPSGYMTITNEKVQRIKPDGALGKRILRAVAEAQCRGRHPAGHRHRV